MHSTEFHHWLQTSYSQIQTEGKSPEPMLETTLARIGAGLATLDSSVVLCFGASATYDSQHDLAYTRTLAFGIKCIETLPENRLLCAQLQMRMADLETAKGEIAKALAIRENANALLSQLEVELIVSRVKNQVQAGYDALKLQSKTTAEHHFLEVMSFNFTNIEEPTAFHILREQYIQAAEGLITCRTGDAKALRNIYFIPATVEILQPILVKAIEMSEK